MVNLAQIQNYILLFNHFEKFNLKKIAHSEKGGERLNNDLSII